MSDLAGFSGLVSIRELGAQGMLTLRGDLNDPQFIAAVTQACGLALPPLRGVVSSGDRSLLWMSPDELALLLPKAQAPDMVAKLTDATAGMHAMVVDVSDARAHFEIEGRVVRETIAKLAPVDMHTDSFATDTLRRTRFGQVAAGFWMPDARRARIFCFRSVRDYMANLLMAAADEHSEVSYFQK